MDRFDDMRSKGLNTYDADATPADILEGKTAYVAGEKIIGILQQNGTGGSGGEGGGTTGENCYMMAETTSSPTVTDKVLGATRAGSTRNRYHPCYLTFLQYPEALPNASEIIDVSLDNNNSVLLCFTSTSGSYLNGYIVASGEIFFPSNCKYLFQHYDNLRGIYNLDIVNTSQVTDMSYMFASCIISTLDVSNFNTSNVTNMSNMFINLKKSTLDVSNWDTNKVTNMSGMFSTTQLTELDLSTWDVRNLTNINYMFNSCSLLTTLDVSGWNTNSLTNMDGTFYACLKLTSLNLSNWNTSSVTTMNGTFQTCPALTTLGDISNWNVENVTNMGNMFYGCSSLTELDLSGWNTNNLTIMNNMFNGCSKLTRLDIRNMNFTKVTQKSTPFYGVPNSCEIIVKDATAQNFVKACNTNLTNIVIA